MKKLFLLGISFIEDIVILLSVMEVTNYNTIAIIGIIFGSLMKNMAILGLLVEDEEES